MIVDRIEGPLAIVERTPKDFVQIPLQNIAGKVRDGAVLTPTDQGYEVDEEATASRRAAHARLLESLFEEV